LSPASSTYNNYDYDYDNNNHLDHDYDHESVNYNFVNRSHYFNNNHSSLYRANDHRSTFDDTPDYDNDTADYDDNAAARTSRDGL
jgi:hypothetical protein